MRAAKEWGLTITQYYELNPIDKAYMLAFILSESKISAIHADESRTK